ncbi:MAG: hypothetical protein R3316_04385 [Rhodovibrionaceae bacterium]|nr:hypothetical protein [Rhodovibrionaceae bacterium]
MICYALLSRILFVIRTLIRVMREIVREIFGWVTRAISAFAALTDHVFSALPWPLNRVFGLVTKVIDGFAEGVDWLGEEVIIRLIDGVTEIVFEYAAYVLSWISWLLDWGIRWLPLLLSKKGVRTPMTVPLCVKILQDNGGKNAMEPSAVNRLIGQANAIMEDSNVQFVHASEMEFIQKQRFFEGVTGGFSGLFRRFFTWFSARAEPGCVTVFVVKEVEGATSCAYPGTNWVVIDVRATGATLVHEVGRLSDFWSRVEPVGDVEIMSAPNRFVLEDQCCMIRTSKFARLPRFDDLM